MNKKINISTSVLVDRLKKGDKVAFEEMYENYSGALFGVILKIVGSQDIAEDVLQDSFVKIWKKIHSFKREKGTFFTWMLNISRNTAIDKYRKLKRQGKVEIQPTVSDVDINSGQSISLNVDHLGLKELVNELDPKHQIMIDYIYFKGYTQKEVSEELGIPLGTVKTRVRTAVAELRKVYISLLILLWI